MEPEDHRYLRIVCCRCGEMFDIPEYCGNRFCEVCCLGRRRRAWRRLTDLTRSVKLLNGHALKHLTLTIRNQPDCRQMCDDILLAFRRLRQRTFWKRYVDGGVFVIEITGHPGNWHVHLHIILACAYVPWTPLRKEWERVSGGLGVYLQKIPRTEIVNYLTKYISKTQLPPPLQMEASRALKNRRLFQPFGSWHNLINSLPKYRPTCFKCGASNFYPLEALCESIRTPSSQLYRGPPVVLNSKAGG